MSWVCPPTTVAISARERAITNSSLGLLNGFAEHLAVVEGPDHPGDVLPLLVALARDQHGVAGARVGHGGGDGGGPVLEDRDLAALVGRDLGGAGEHGGQDRERV